MASRAKPDFDLLDFLVGGGAPVTRHQDPKISIRRDVPRPFFYIRPYVMVKTETGVVRKQRRIPLGFCDEITMKQAKAAKQEFMATVNSGKRLLQSQIPFTRVLDKYIEGAMPLLGTATQYKYAGIINRRIRPAFEKKMMHQVTTQEIQVLINASTNLGYFARQDLRNTVSAIFTYAEEIGIFDGPNPCRKVRCGRKSFVREKRIPTPAQFEAFLTNIKDAPVCSAHEARLMILTAAVSGLRISEILGLQPRDLDIKAQALTVRRRWYRGDLAEPKTENSRRTRYVGRLIEALAQQALDKKADAFLFAGESGEPPDARHLQRHSFRPAAEKAGCYFPGFGPHTFRRLNVTWRQECGATAIEAQKAAGHTSLDMTWLYTVTDVEREKEHVDRLWARLPGGKKLA